jgi:hypothetical protein
VGYFRPPIIGRFSIVMLAAPTLAALALFSPLTPSRQERLHGVKMAVGQWQTTESGLRFVDVMRGTGEVPEAGDSVAVQYTAKIASGDLTGQVYDTTRPPSGSGEPYLFKLGKRRVVQGWDEGVSTMRVGGRRTLAIPNLLGYGGLSYVGNRQRVPPGADLEIDVELVELPSGVDFAWTQRIFTLENAGPFAILLVVGVFQGLAAMPPDDLPPWLVNLIPTVLGSQFRRE